MTPVPSTQSGVEEVPCLQSESLVSAVNYTQPPSILPRLAPSLMACSAGGYAVVQMRKPRLGGHTVRQGENWLLTMELRPCFVSSLPSHPLHRAGLPFLGLTPGSK